MIPKSQLIKRIDAMLGGGNSSSSSILSAVSFDKNRLYYNGETYHLQFGWNKRIMCVTKGDKYAIINSPDYTGSRIEAATAVMKGLTESWDLEFDYYSKEGYNLNLSRVIYSGSVSECDWGDGSTDNTTEHYYNSTGAVRVRVKLTGTEATFSFPDDLWAGYSGENPPYAAGQGQSIHIGGKLSSISFATGEYTGDYLTFGESVKRINDNPSSGFGFMSASKLPKGRQHGIPPFVEYIGKHVFQYSGSGYIYIPKSCTQIDEGAFYCHTASVIEIEEEGGALSLGDRCFSKTSNSLYCQSTPMVSYISIPGRASAAGGETIKGCGAGGVKFGSGLTEITTAMVYEGDKTYGSFGGIIDTIPYFLFIPKTVKTIGDNLISYDSKRPVYIICEGSWSSITKSSNWDGASGSRENVTIIKSHYEAYNNAENIIKTFIKG